MGMRACGMLPARLEAEMWTTLLGLMVLSPAADALEFSSDVRAERTGSVEVFYGTDLTNHFLGSQFYLTDALMVRLHALMFPHPSADEIRAFEEIQEFVGDTDPLPLSENEYRTFTVHPGAFYSVAQFGDSSSAVVLQTGGQLLFCTDGRAEEYKEAIESIDGLEVNSNARRLYVQPTVGAAYVNNFETGSFEVDLATGPLLRAWGDTGYGTSEVDGTEYDGRDLLRPGWSSLLQLGLRWKRLVVIAGAAHTVYGNSRFRDALCESDSFEGDCSSSLVELLPMVAIGGSLGG